MGERWNDTYQASCEAALYNLLNLYPGCNKHIQMTMIMQQMFAMVFVACCNRFLFRHWPNTSMLWELL